MQKLSEFNVDEALDSVDLSFPGYIPSTESLEYFAIMRLVTGKDFEFSTPMWHYFLVDVMLGMIDDKYMFPYSREVCEQIGINKNRIGVMASRGLAKSSVVTAFFPIYCAIKGNVPGRGHIHFLLALGASAQGGGRVMAKAIESMCEDSKFCDEFFEHMRFTETEAEFVRKGSGSKDSRTFLVRTMGVGTGSIRGVRSNVGAHRPDGILFDDCIPNAAAAFSETQIKNLDDAMNSDAINALKGGGKGFIVCVFTPFHNQDSNVKNILNKSYTPIIIPICEKIDGDLVEKDFTGAWEDMHPYSAVIDQYKQAERSGALSSFMTERMLRMASEEDRMISEDMIQWYDRNMVMKLISGYRLYMTTDFTTTSSSKSDYSALALWAVSSEGDFFLLDLCLKKQELADQYNEVFRMLNTWGRRQSIEVGVEIDGQQKAHLFSLKELMIKKGKFFSFARQKGASASQQGIRSASAGKKIDRFRYVLPRFQSRKIWFPEQLRYTPEMKEGIKQLRGATVNGFTSHDDFCFSGDTEVTMRDGTGQRIDCVAVGDQVREHVSGKGYCRVNSVIITEAKEVNRYYLSDGTYIDSTDNHPVLTVDGYKPIAEIHIKGLDVWKVQKKSCIVEELRCAPVGVEIKNDETLQPIRVVGVRALPKQTVYNLSTDSHTYVANDVLVHNCDVVSQIELLDAMFGSGTEFMEDELTAVDADIWSRVGGDEDSDGSSVIF
jgi:phage terminase large subunit-like protein